MLHGHHTQIHTFFPFPSPLYLYNHLNSLGKCEACFETSQCCQNNYSYPNQGDHVLYHVCTHLHVAPSSKGCVFVVSRWSKAISE